MQVIVDQDCPLITPITLFLSAQSGCGPSQSSIVFFSLRARLNLPLPLIQPILFHPHLPLHLNITRSPCGQPGAWSICGQRASDLSTDAAVSKYCHPRRPLRLFPSSLKQASLVNFGCAVTKSYSWKKRLIFVLYTFNHSCKELVSGTLLIWTPWTSVNPSFWFISKPYDLWHRWAGLFLLRFLHANTNLCRLCSSTRRGIFSWSITFKKETIIVAGQRSFFPVIALTTVTAHQYLLCLSNNLISQTICFVVVDTAATHHLLLFPATLDRPNPILPQAKDASALLPASSAWLGSIIPARSLCRTEAAA